MQVRRIIVTGLPGMGKSWLLEQIRKLLFSSLHSNVVLIDDYPFMLQAALAAWRRKDYSVFLPIGNRNFDIQPGKHAEVFARAMDEVARTAQAIPAGVCCLIEIARRADTLVDALACLIDDQESTLIIYIHGDLETGLEHVERRMKRQYGDRHGATVEAYRRNYGSGPYPSAEEVVSALTERYPHVKVAVIKNDRGVSLRSFKRQARKLLNSLASSWQEDQAQS